MAKTENPTISISINIAQANAYEGNSQMVTNVNPQSMMEFSDSALGVIFRNLINEAVQDFDDRNSVLTDNVSLPILRAAIRSAKRKFNELEVAYRSDPTSISGRRAQKCLDRIEKYQTSHILITGELYEW